MAEPRLVIDTNPPRGWIETVERRVENHNVAVTGLSDYYPVAFVIRGSDRRVTAGILGNIWGGWLHVRRFWVERELRNRGYATWLMGLAEEYAWEKKCVGAFLSTQSYQARPLYENLGYSVFGQLNDHPVKGHSRYFMRKTLSAAVAAGSAPDDAELVKDPYVPPDAIAAIQWGMAMHAAGALGLPEYTLQPWRGFLRNDNGEVVGGALGNTWGLWLFISHLWVDRPLRGRGFATRLMAAGEDAAARRGCTGAFLETFSFNARPLYEGLGYSVFAELKDHPEGHSHYFTAKRLAA